MKGKKLIAYLFLLVFSLSVFGCGIHTIKTEFNLPNQNIQTDIEENKTKVIFFNDSNMILYGIDGSGKINIKIDGKALGSLKIHNYVQIFLDQGTYDLNLAHWDLVTFQSNYKINIGKDDVYIKIYSQPTSTVYQIVDKLPVNFTQKYKPIS